ncbi:MAG: dihydrodipicolinate synthase family protein [Clostridia bacterium]|nr:dihydrodipicolinate synthase family protein [Clostridia bacterium]
MTGVVVDLVTPFDEGGALLLDLFEHNVDMLLSSGGDAVVAAGSAGEYFQLRDDEYAALVATAVDVAGGQRVLAGAFGETAAACLRRIEGAAAAGAGGAVVAVPPDVASGSNGEEAEAFLYEVADAAALPVWMASWPVPAAGRAVLPLPIDAVERLSTHPRVAGLIDASGDVGLVGAYCLAAPGLPVLTACGASLCAALLMGSAGCAALVANAAPWECAAIVAAGREGRWNDAVAVQRRLLPLALRVEGPNGLATAKAAMRVRGFFGGWPRRPLRTLTAEEEAELLQVLATSGLISGCG